MKSKQDIRLFLEKWFLIFILFSVFGWCYEVFLEVVVYRWGFTNRGVLFGPYCPVYGVCGLIFLFLYKKCLEGRISPRASEGGRGRTAGKVAGKAVEVALAYILTALVATLIELIASYILEFFTGHWMWETYVNYKYNFQGRIALSTSLRFGIGGLIFIYGFYPFLNKFFSKMAQKKLHLTALVVGVIFVCDMVYSFFLK